MALGTSCAIVITASAGADYEDSWTNTLATLMYITFGSSVFINSVVTVSFSTSSTYLNTEPIQGLIVSRLYRLGRRAAAGRDKHPYLRIIAALVESGSLFLFSVTIYLILYATGVGYCSPFSYHSLSDDGLASIEQGWGRGDNRVAKDNRDGADIDHPRMLSMHVSLPTCC